jgi:hypothetical protein
LLGKPRDVAQRLVLASVFAVRQNRERLKSLQRHLSGTDGRLFFRGFERCKNDFEWGSGGSTAQAVLQAENVVSLESDCTWHDNLKQIIGYPPQVVWLTFD